MNITTQPPANELGSQPEEGHAEQVLQQPQADLARKTPQLLTASAILKEAWLIYKKRFWQLVGITVLPILAIFAFGLVLAFLWGVGIFSLQAAFSLTGILLFAAVFIALQLGLMVVQGLAHTALIYAVSAETPLGVGAACRAAWRRLLSYWWLQFLAGFVLFGGLILFLVPGVFLAVGFSIALFVFMVEDRKGIAALRASRAYVRGRWWNVLWRLLFIVGTVSLASLLLFGVTTFFIGLLFFFPFVLLAVPLFTAYLYILYRELRRTASPAVLKEAAEGSRAPYVVFAVVGALALSAMISAPILLRRFGVLKEQVYWEYGTSVPRAEQEEAIAEPIAQLFNARRMQDLSTLEGALLRFYNEKGSYPERLTELESNALPHVPTDPKSQLPYKYMREGDGTQYRLCAVLNFGELECRYGISGNRIRAPQIP